MFKAVAESGGFNQAASAVHKSQSSIHHAVNKLEEGLGINLLQASGRKTLLTPTGELMLRRANYLLEEMNRIEAVVQQLSKGVESRLRIALDGAFPQNMVLKALVAVSDVYPQTNIDIVDTVLSGTNELIDQGKVDLGISPLVLPNSLSEEICQIKFILVAHHQHPLLQLQTQLDLVDLKGHRQIVVRDSATENKISSGWLGAEQQWTVSNMRASIDLVTQGMGYASLPEPLIGHYLESQVLKPLPIDTLDAKQDLGGCRNVSFYLNFQDDEQLGPAAREFIGQLRLLTMDMPISE
jgi:DNA-binding transcriptional LysR family regulator